MNEHIIKRYYIILSLINLTIVVIFSLVPSELEISERIETAIRVNIIFHLVYQLFSRFPLWVFEWANKDQSRDLKFAIKFIIVFAIAMMILPFLSAAFILKSVIFEQAYHNLYNLIFLSGVFLGGFFLKSKFRAIESIYNNR